ncbi:MAG: 4-(cytidine 5'-diphospho)-2-C-methyl-D-erythritol kinase, partial [Solirubrobacteraceae bacterium]
MSELAPAKINLCLFLGSTRADGRHELVSVMQSLAWGDAVAAEPAERDEVVCPGVEGPNLAAAALAAIPARRSPLR